MKMLLATLVYNLAKQKTVIATLCNPMNGLINGHHYN